MGFSLVKGLLVPKEAKLLDIFNILYRETETMVNNPD